MKESLDQAESSKRSLEQRLEETGALKNSLLEKLKSAEESRDQAIAAQKSKELLLKEQEPKQTEARLKT